MLIADCRDSSNLSVRSNTWMNCFQLLQGLILQSLLYLLTSSLVTNSEGLFQSAMTHQRVGRTNLSTWQSAIYCPWLSLPALIPARRILLPASDILAIIIFSNPMQCFFHPVRFRCMLVLHAPGVRQFTMIFGASDSVTLFASSRTKKTSMSFETA